MKKNITIIALILVSLCSICLATAKNSNHSLNEVQQANITMSAMSNSNLFAINHPIEVNFLKEQEQLSGATAELTKFYSDYGQLWANEVSKYNALIETELELDNASQYETFSNYKLIWEQYSVQQIEFYKSLEEDYGTLMASNIERSIMRIYRSRALELIQIYDKLMTGLPWHWDYNWGLNTERGTASQDKGDGSSVLPTPPSPAVD